MDEREQGQCCTLTSDADASRNLDIAEGNVCWIFEAFGGDRAAALSEA